MLPEVTKFAEASAVGLDTKLYKVTKCRNAQTVRLKIGSDQYKVTKSRDTHNVRWDIGSDLYKIFASLASDWHNYLVEFEMYCRHLILRQPADWIL